MNKVISLKRATKLSKKIHSDKKIVVVAGGFFDILHLGHIRFLKNAKKQGNYLFILLESDEAARKLKGESRPIHTQEERAEILSAINFIDYIILLDSIKSDQDYDKIVVALKPNIIAVTKGSPTGKHSKRQADLIGAKVLEVIDKIPNKSTTSVAEIISKDF